MPRTPLILVAMVLCGLALGAASPAQAAPTRAELKLIARINDARAAHGLRKLKPSARLHRGARRWAGHLLRSGSFYHSSLAAGTSENLAWGTCSWINARAVVRMWMNSSAHRANLLRRGVSRVGTGVRRGPWRGYGCVRMYVARFR
jgi:uncharacterized protein YkwD